MNTKLQRITAPALAAAAILATTNAIAADPVTRSFCDPTAITNASEIVYNGVAKKDAAKGMWLTQAGATFKAGSAFFKDRLELKSGMVDRSFWTYFRFRIEGDPDGGNGLTFIMHDAQAGASALGSNGDGLGFGGITKSIIFEFDTHVDMAGGPNHISLLLDGNQDFHHADVLSGAPAAFITPAGIDVWLEYDHTIPTFKLYVANPKNPPITLPADVVWDVNPGGVSPDMLDIGGIITGGYVGFTSATGSLTNDHEIQKWEFSTLGIPCDCIGTQSESDAYCFTRDNKEPHCASVVTQAGPTGKVCVECVQNPDCKDPTKPRCDILDLSKTPQGFGTCEPCQTDPDCTHIPGLPHCETTTGECKECIVDVDCKDPTKPVCDPANNKCITGCIKDEDCPSPTQPRCDTAVHQCDLCTSDANCTRFAPTPLCGADTTNNPGICVECNTNPDCAANPTEPVCDTTTNTCVECNTNEDCNDPAKPDCDTTAHQCVCPAGQTCPPPPSGKYIEGGGCDCNLPATTSKNTLAALTSLAIAALATTRRRRRR